MDHKEVIIAAAARTPSGSLLGQFTNLTATELGSNAIQAAVERSSLTFDAIDSVIMGCVLAAGLGQAPARQAALGAGLSVTTGCTTINKMCGSGMKAVMLAFDAIRAGSYNVMIAGGMESMTNAPHLLAKARQGYRLGHAKLFDHMLTDGLEDAYDKGKHMGCYADETAEHFGITREAQDEFAIASVNRAHTATQKALFKDEITAVTVNNKNGDIKISADELPAIEKLIKIPHLKPVFSSTGTVTAANASSISDGAAALVICNRAAAEKHQLQARAVIRAHATHSQEPKWFTTAPIAAIQKVLAKANWNINDVDLFEINEAFAVVTLAAMQELRIPHDIVNVNGGACALGHPIGASGARIIVSLIHALRANNLQRGVAALCIGGGEATAIAIELA